MFLGEVDFPKSWSRTMNATILQRVLKGNQYSILIYENRTPLVCRVGVVLRYFVLRLDFLTVHCFCSSMTSGEIRVSS
jgi:hypothetical protein